MKLDPSPLKFVWLDDGRINGVPPYWSVNSNKQKAVLAIESVNEILKFEHSNKQMKASEQYVPVVLYTCVLYYAVQGDLNFWVGELRCDHSNESNWVVLALWYWLLTP